MAAPIIRTSVCFIWLAACLRWATLASPTENSHAEEPHLARQAEQLRRQAAAGDLTGLPSLLEAGSDEVRRFWPTFFALAAVNRHAETNGASAVAFHNPFIGSAWIIHGSNSIPVKNWDKGYLWLVSDGGGTALQGPLAGLERLVAISQQKLEASAWWKESAGGREPSDKLNLVIDRQQSLLAGFVVTADASIDSGTAGEWQSHAARILGAAATNGVLQGAHATLRTNWISLSPELRKQFRATAIAQASDQLGVIFSCFSDPQWWLVAGEPLQNGKLVWFGRLPEPNAGENLASELGAITSASLAKVDQRFGELHDRIAPALKQASRQLVVERAANLEAIQAADRALATAIATLAVGASLTIQSTVTALNSEAIPPQPKRGGTSQSILVERRRAFRAEMNAIHDTAGERETGEMLEKYHSLRWINFEEKSGK